MVESLALKLSLLPGSVNGCSLLLSGLITLSLKSGLL